MHECGIGVGSSPWDSVFTEKKLHWEIIPCYNKVQNNTILHAARISNYIQRKVWDEITYPLPNFNGITVEVLEWIILPHTLLGMWSLTHGGIKVKPY